MSDTVKLIVTLNKGQYENLKNIHCGSIGSKMIVNAVMNGMPLDSIKAEIKEKCDSWEKDGYLDEADALNVALKIIDKHIGKAESEE